MNVRGVLLIVMIWGAGIVAATSSCNAPDPGEITFSERPRGSSGEIGGEAGPIGEGGLPAEGGAEGGSSGSVDPVFGTSTFALGSTGPGGPAKNADPAHNGDSSGQDCITCHFQGGAGTPWAFAGTLYTNTTGAAPVKDAEIRVTGPDGKEYAHTYSDVDGNFWIDATGTPFPANCRVGVRTADKKLLMSGVIGAGQAGCQQGGTCHGGSQGKVYLQ